MSKLMEKATEASGFLDGREYTAAFLYEFFSLIVGNGVYTNELAPTATNENMTITHGAGHAWINGVCYKNTTPFILDIATADGVLNRYDSLMLRLNLSINEVYAVIVQGDYATNPTPPAVTRNQETFDLKICDIYIPAGCTKITQTQVTDTRMDASVCGVPMFPVEHLDMTKFYQQVATDLDELKTKEQAEILELLERLNTLVSGDAVGQLLTELGGKAPISHIEDLKNPHGTTAEQVGARSNTWLPTLAEIGAAPSSYGLGTSGELKEFTKLEDLNTLTKNGWYFARFASPITIDGYSVQFMVVEVCGETEQHVHQILHLIGSNYKIHRYSDNGSWYNHEWENPPMALGVEYRTTERFNGKAVCTKCVNCGALANKMSVIPHNIAMTNPISCVAFVDGQTTAPSNYQEESKLVAYATYANVFIYSNGIGDAVGKTVYAILKYTKD